MKNKIAIIIFLIALLSSLYSQTIHYDLKVIIDNKNSYIKVDGKGTLDKSVKSVEFYLNENLNIRLKDDDLRLTVISSSENYKKYEITSDKKFKSFNFEYEGVIYYPVSDIKEEYQRGFRTTRGLISEDGCYLVASTYWYPYMDDYYYSFNIRFDIHKEYEVITAGRRIFKKIYGNNKLIEWKNDHSLDDIPVVCGKYIEYRKKYKDINLYVFLRSPDDELAYDYLNYAAKYINMYSNLIGKYPFKKFAAVENFWETGYGFPSFTLLGPQVMRFPFILITSYPHEILHNWWGNGVFVDYDKGNWCEGLTAYMADYMVNEQKGRGNDYRISTIKKYNDYVKENKEFPLSEFKERHSASSEAIGYGKSLMFYHMLRHKLGDKKFISILRDFYNKYKFRKVGYKELQEIFEKKAGKEYGNVFKQWIYRKGIPEIHIKKTDLSYDGKQYSISMVLSQKGDIYDLDIPVAVFFEKDEPEIFNLKLNSREKNFYLKFDRKPVAVKVDPEFDIIRKVLKGELPPTISEIIGDDNISILFSTQTYSYRSFLKLYEGKKYEIVNNIPQDKSIWILGYNKDIFDSLKNFFKDYGVDLESDKVIINNIPFDITNSMVMVFKNPYNDEHSMGIIFSPDYNIESLAFKLPHYGKYSFLVFDENMNIVYSDKWGIKNSPMMIYFENKKIKEIYPERKALTYYVYPVKKEGLKQHIEFLSTKLKTRHPGSKEIKKASDYIEEKFVGYGLKPFFNESYRQSFKLEYSSSSYISDNICAYTESNSGKYILVSAHYDHLFPLSGKFYPGANDNASGVSLLLELSRYFKNNLLKNKGIIFCAFSGEEEGRVGSRYFASNINKKIKSSIIANVNIDTIGHLNVRNLSVLNWQSSPVWPKLFKLASLKTMVDYNLLHMQIDSSDQMSFIEENIPAVQLFDGGDLTYHTPDDTENKIDYRGLENTAEFVIALLNYIDKENFLPFASTLNQEKVKKGRKRISLGFMPDFAYSGKGVRIAKVRENSTGYKYGLKEGDVIVSVNGNSVNNLMDYTDIMSRVSFPIEIEYLRDGKIERIEIK